MVLGESFVYVPHWPITYARRGFSKTPDAARRKALQLVGYSESDLARLKSSELLRILGVLRQAR